MNDAAELPRALEWSRSRVSRDCHPIMVAAGVPAGHCQCNCLERTLVLILELTFVAFLCYSIRKNGVYYRIGMVRSV